MKRRKTVRSAQVFAFPPARHRKIVSFIVSEMLKAPSLDAAEEALAEHLWIDAGRLAGLGISDDDIDRFCREFARAAWVAYFKDRAAKGVA